MIGPPSRSAPGGTASPLGEPAAKRRPTVETANRIPPEAFEAATLDLIDEIQRPPSEIEPDLSEGRRLERLRRRLDRLCAEVADLAAEALLGCPERFVTRRGVEHDA